MQDNRDGYGGGGDVGGQKMRRGTTEMVKWVVRTATDWANIDRERLRAYRRSGMMGMADKISGEDSGGRSW